jgi:hypothetical protein
MEPIEPMGPMGPRLRSDSNRNNTGHLHHKSTADPSSLPWRLPPELPAVATRLTASRSVGRLNFCRRADLPIPLSILNIAAAPNSRIDDSPSMNHRGVKYEDPCNQAYPNDPLGPSQLSRERESMFVNEIPNKFGAHTCTCSDNLPSQLSRHLISFNPLVTWPHIPIRILNYRSQSASRICWGG